MKIFITGANGFLGSHLVDALLERAEVHVLVRKTSNLTWLLGKKIHYHYGDITGDLKALRQGLQGADLLFHIAGVIHSPRVATYYKVNTEGTANVLEACLQVNPHIKRVVVVTSLAAHGPNLTAESAAQEEDACHPITDYGCSKRDAELVSFKYGNQLPIAIVRPPAIYGPRDSQILPIFQLAKRGLFFLPGWGQRTLNLAHVQDVVSGLVLAAEHPRAAGETFFIGSEKNDTWEEMGSIIGKAVRRPHLRYVRIPEWFIRSLGGMTDILSTLLDRSFPMNGANAKNFIQKNWSLDISKARKLLGFQPAYSLARGSEETVDWYQNEGWM